MLNYLKTWRNVRKVSNSVSLIQPIYQKKPLGKRRLMMRVFGAAAGFGVGCGLIILVEFFNPAFRKPEDFTNLTDIPVFVTIPQFSWKELNS